MTLGARRPTKIELLVSENSLAKALAHLALMVTWHRQLPSLGLALAIVELEGARLDLAMEILADEAIARRGGRG